MEEKTLGINEEITSTESPVGENKICECGFENTSNANYCAKCGKQLEKKQTEESTVQYCNECGNKVEKGAAFCNACGKEILKDIRIEPSPMPPITENNINIMIILKILTCVSLISFFMTFVTETAFGMKISMNGFEAALGTFFSSELRQIVNSEELAPNFFVVVSLACCVLSLFYTWQKGTNIKDAFIFNIVSAVSLILYMITYEKYYGGNDYAPVVSTTFGFAVWAIIIINAVCAVLVRSGSVNNTETKEED